VWIVVYELRPLAHRADNARLARLARSARLRRLSPHFQPGTFMSGCVTVLGQYDSTSPPVYTGVISLILVSTREIATAVLAGQHRKLRCSPLPLPASVSTCPCPDPLLNLEARSQDQHI
jgi:hypothetical protein